MLVTNLAALLSCIDKNVKGRLKCLDDCARRLEKEMKAVSKNVRCAVSVGLHDEYYRQDNDDTTEARPKLTIEAAIEMAFLAQDKKHVVARLDMWRCRDIERVPREKLGAIEGIISKKLSKPETIVRIALLRSHHYGRLWPSDSGNLPSSYPLALNSPLPTVHQYDA
jgi:hypothetical protein